MNFYLFRFCATTLVVAGLLIFTSPGLQAQGPGKLETDKPKPTAPTKKGSSKVKRKPSKGASKSEKEGSKIRSRKPGIKKPPPASGAPVSRPPSRGSSKAEKSGSRLRSRKPGFKASAPASGAPVSRPPSRGDTQPEAAGSRLRRASRAGGFSSSDGTSGLPNRDAKPSVYPSPSKSDGRLRTREPATSPRPDQLGQRLLHNRDAKPSVFRSPSRDRLLHDRPAVVVPMPMQNRDRFLRQKNVPNPPGDAGPASFLMDRRPATVPRPMQNRDRFLRQMDVPNPPGDAGPASFLMDRPVKTLGHTDRSPVQVSPGVLHGRMRNDKAARRQDQFNGPITAPSFRAQERRLRQKGQMFDQYTGDIEIPLYMTEERRFRVKDKTIRNFRGQASSRIRDMEERRLVRADRMIGDFRGVIRSPLKNRTSYRRKARQVANFRTDMQVKASRNRFFAGYVVVWQSTDGDGDGKAVWLNRILFRVFPFLRPKDMKRKYTRIARDPKESTIWAD